MFIRMKIKTAFMRYPLKQCAMSWCSFLFQAPLIFQKYINNTKAVRFWVLLLLELIMWVPQSILSLYIIHQPYFPIVQQCPAMPHDENNHSIISPVRKHIPYFYTVSFFLYCHIRWIKKRYKIMWSFINLWV